MPPYPLLTQDALERRLDDPSAIKADYAATDTDWQTLIEEIIEEESGYVGQLLREQGVNFADYPTRTDLLTEYSIVRTAMVRLCRQAIHTIEEDGLESESAADRSESYRPPSAIREEVANLIETIDVPTDSDGDGTPDTRITLI